MVKIAEIGESSGCVPDRKSRSGKKKMANKATEQLIDSDGEITENLRQIEPMERDGERFNSQYDGIYVGFIAPDDEFVGSDDDVRILPTNHDEEDEEIPQEVIEKLKTHPVMQQFIGEVVKQALNQ